MKLNKNSISARLYRWFYMVDYLPMNLCPYFWKLVIVYLTLLPYLLIYAPKKIFDVISGDNSDDKMERLGGGLLMYFFILCLISLGFFVASAFTTFYEGTVGYAFFVPGAIVAFLIVVLSVLGFAGWIIDKRREKPHSNVLVEYAKAKYNKYCPTIEWEDESETNQD
jgi:hypothetical protein